eukprot:TRINITY_DN2289_c0_g1_i1.p1 TRINITY_DN2289_c0_g1~~TRINITY_DN2289_c0_g1_i1.p1  ORF type:complete len:258 (-),score=68.80 TRINITY_DN2289_c0_g1_i1:97-870(-)
MKEINSKHVLKLMDYWETAEQIFIATELMTGGNLFYNITTRGKYSENDARVIVHQILLGVDALHKAGVCHRNLKPENILCSREDDRVVLSDFGLSKIFGKGELMQSQSGTPGYVAPEVIKGGSVYDKAVDMWAVGVITYILLCGFQPFQPEASGGGVHSVLEKAARGEFSFPSPHWDNISPLAKDFICQLLQVSPNLRLTSSQALVHLWVQGPNTENVPTMDVDISFPIKEGLKNNFGCLGFSGFDLDLSTFEKNPW